MPRSTPSERLIGDDPVQQRLMAEVRRARRRQARRARADDRPARPQADSISPAMRSCSALATSRWRPCARPPPQMARARDDTPACARGGRQTDVLGGAARRRRLGSGSDSRADRLIALAGAPFARARPHRAAARGAGRTAAHDPRQHRRCGDHDRHRRPDRQAQRGRRGGDRLEQRRGAWPAARRGVSDRQRGDACTGREPGVARAPRWRRRRPGQPHAADSQGRQRDADR